MEIFKVWGSVFLKDEEAVKGLDNIDKKAKNTGEKFKSMGDKVSSVGSSMTKWVTGPAMAMGAAAFGLMTKFGNYADTLLDLNAITGLSTDEMFRWRELAVRAGVDLDIVASSMQTLNKQIERGNEVSPRLAKGFDAMGISVEDFKKLEADIQMRKIVETMMDMEEADARAFANQMGMPDLLPIISELQSEGKSLDQVMSEIDVPYSNEDLNKMNEFRKEWDSLKNTLFLVMGEALQPLFEMFSQNKEAIAGSLVPAIQSLVGNIVKLVEWFAGLSPVWQKVVAVAGMFMVVLGPILMIVGKIISIIGVLMPYFPAIKAGILALSGPIGWVIAAIVGLIAAGVLLYKNWDKIIEWCGKLKDQIIANFKKLKDNALKSFKELQAKATAFITKFIDDSVARLNNLKSKASIIIRNTKNYIIAQFNNLKSKVSAIVSVVKNAVTSRIARLKSLVVRIIGSLRNIAVARFSSLRNSALRIVTSLKNGMISRVNAAKNRVSSTFNSIKSAITRPINSAANTVKRVINKIKGWFSGLKLKLPALKFPKIKMPKFNISGKFGLTPPSVPKLSLSWFKTGGVMQDPFIMGNAGFGDVAEAIVPFEGPHANRIAGLIADHMPGTSGGYKTANITLNIDGRDLVRIIGQPLVDEIRLRTGMRI